MALTSGTKLGRYEIVSALGAGGMGEVYRARDPRLSRDVAIKILPCDLSSNPDLKARFEREARAISALSHPHICHLYDVDAQDGIDYLVMELLEGQPLNRRLEKGPLPLQQALQCGIEIAEALEKAHKSGIVHRDLKPGNIMLTKSGAKLLDFGLAKPLDGIGSMMSGSAATMSRPLTQEGRIVGTFQYMSPEQLQGQEADARSDIFALGAVLYEMLTGKRAFEGKTQISVMSAILEKEPSPVSAVQPLTPSTLDHVIQRALAKDPQERWQNAADVKAELKWIASTGRQAEQRTGGAKGIIPALAVACLLLIVALGTAIFYSSKPSPPPPEVRSSIAAPERSDFLLMDDDAAGPVVISPDGANLAFTARDEQGRPRIWIRALSGGESRALSGGDSGTYPFWSPDGKWLGFFSNGKLRKASIEGGPVMEIAEAPRGRGGSWNKDNLILFAPAPTGPLFLVPANGGTARAVTKIDPAFHTTHRWPVWLVDGHHFIYLASSHGNAGANSHNGIYVASLDGQNGHILMPSDSNAVVAPGYLLYVQDAVLMAVPFNEKRAELEGDSSPVAQEVALNQGTWRCAVDVSRNGILVYQAGSNDKPSELLWYAPGNQPARPAATSRGNYRDLRLSPDGHKLAITIGSPHAELWIYDLTRGVNSRLTFTDSAYVSTAVWSPDSKHLAFSVVGNSGTRMFVKEAGGSAKEQELFSSGTILDTVDDWSQDGQMLLYHAVPAAASPIALFVLPMSGESKPRQFLSAAPFPILQARFSPDGKWVAYLSPESGIIQAYVTSFPDASGKWQISSDGTVAVGWLRNGQALLYQKTDGSIVKVPFAAHGKDVQIGAAQLYVNAHPRTTTYNESWDVAPDGRIIANTDIVESTHVISVVVNWTAELKK
jgi:serine/threonine protein kinase/Tol biopolymer transport system component